MILQIRLSLRSQILTRPSSRIFFPGVNFTAFLGEITMETAAFFGFQPTFCFRRTTSKIPQFFEIPVDRREPDCPSSSPVQKKLG